LDLSAELQQQRPQFLKVLKSSGVRRNTFGAFRIDARRSNISNQQKYFRQERLVRGETRR